MPGIEADLGEDDVQDGEHEGDELGEVQIRRANVLHEHGGE